MPRFDIGVTEDYFRPGAVTIDAATPEAAEAEFQRLNKEDPNGLYKRVVWEDLRYSKGSFERDCNEPEEVDSEE